MPSDIFAQPAPHYMKASQKYITERLTELSAHNTVENEVDRAINQYCYVKHITQRHIDIKKDVNKIYYSALWSWLRAFKGEKYEWIENRN